MRGVSVAPPAAGAAEVVAASSRRRSNSTRVAGISPESFRHARLGGVEAQLQLVELHAAVGHPHDLAVGDERRRGRLEQRDELGEVPAERAAVAAHEAERPSAATATIVRNPSHFGS